MAAAAIQAQNPPVKSDSKSAKKKKAKTPSAETEAPSASGEAAVANSQAESTSGDGSYESPYIKELYKNIRNANKKIANASKVDGIVAEHSGKTLDQLVAERKINADQKAQILKKPALLASLAQLEEQIAQYKKFDQEYKTRSQAEKADFEKTLTERASKELEDAVVAAKTEAVTTARKEQESSLLLLSQFLRLAAIRRGEDEDPELEENKALEGLLARVYTGDGNAVASMLNLINGSGDAVTSVNNEVLAVTYADIKRVTLAQAPQVAVNEGVAESVAELEVKDESDATISNVTEPEAAATSTNGQIENAQDLPKIPANGETATGAATDFDIPDMSTSQEWVEVPRDAVTDTEPGVAVTASIPAPANAAAQNSWADDQPDSPTETTGAAPASKDDGFHEVQRSRGGRDRGQGQHRGRGGRGDGYRGRGGYRGDGYRGRGRGGGNRGGAARRPDES